MRCLQIDTGRSAFTRTEFLVVITIIVVLTGFIINAGTCPGTPKQAEITLEIYQLDNAVEDFKADYGAYPPNLNANSIRSQPDLNISIPEEDVLLMFKRAFPRSLEPEGVILGLAGGGDNLDSSRSLQGGMTASESLFFWLGGFSQDPQYPLSSPGGPSFTDADSNNDGILDTRDDKLEGRNLRYEFDRHRLGPRTNKGFFDDNKLAKGGGRFIEYDDPRNDERRRINLWQYFPASSKVSFAYV